MRRNWFFSLTLVLLGLVQCQQAPLIETALVTASVTQADLTGFERAVKPDAVQFPRDLGAHEAFQTEWWYYTGNLETADGRPFGYQLTIFRRALTPPLDLDDEALSTWRTNQVYFAHATLSDIAEEQFYHGEIISRGAAGLAGAQAVPHRVWIDDWQIAEQTDGSLHLTAAQGGIGFDLTLVPTQPPVVHGQGGLMPRGPERGNASHYYSFVHLQTSGQITIGEAQYAVTGLSWKDHEYATGALSAEAVGWDWFSLQFVDTAEPWAMTFAHIRREDGTLEPLSGGSWIDSESNVTPLTLADVNIEVLDEWTSPAGTTYPAKWRITSDLLELDLIAEPLMAAQELDLTQTVYWEGAVSYTGTLKGEPVTAVGYVELTGYAHTMKGRV